jgi:hypothetical protein
MRMPRTGAIVAGATVLALAGCGSSGRYRNDPRPPAPIVITAAIGKDRVSVSPRRFGAGPVSLVITNQTAAAQQVTFSSSGGQAGFTQQTGPINPSDTATLKADVPQGAAVVKVTGNAIRPARINVGPQRPSAQNDLLQP